MALSAERPTRSIAIGSCSSRTRGTYHIGTVLARPSTSMCQRNRPVIGSRSRPGITSLLSRNMRATWHSSRRPGLPHVSCSKVGARLRAPTPRMIYPSTYLACTIDCAWYLELHPLSPSRTRMIYGALFPRDRTLQPDFEDHQKLLSPLGSTIEEDIVASERQQKGLDTPFAPPGRSPTASHWCIRSTLDPRPGLDE